MEGGKEERTDMEIMEGRKKGKEERNGRMMGSKKKVKKKCMYMLL